MTEIIIIVLLIIATFLTYCIVNEIHDKVGSYMSFRESMDLTSLPVITFYQGDNKLNFMLDTGSNDNVINTCVLDTIKYTDIDKPTILTGVGGNIVCNSVNIEFTYKDTKYKAIFRSTDLHEAFDSIKKETGVTIHGIIGSNFFKKYEYVLDFEKLVAYSKK